MNNRTTGTQTPFKGETMIKGTLLAAYRRSILVGFIAIALTFFACSSSNDDDETPISNFGTPVPASSFTFADIKYWVGTGDSKAMMLVQWNDSGKTIPDALVWGYKFNVGDSVKGSKMILDIMKADKRFYLMGNDGLSTEYEGVTYYVGLAIGGIGFDLDTNLLSLTRNGSTWDPNVLPRFFVPDSNYDYDGWECGSGTTACASIHWQSGWKNGNWWYDTTNTNNFASSVVGVSSRTLKDGSRDAHYFVDEAYVWPNAPPILTTYTPVLPPK